MRTRPGQGFVAPNVEPVPLKRKASHADVLDQPGDPMARRVALAAFDDSIPAFQDFLSDRQVVWWETMMAPSTAPLRR